MEKEAGEPWRFAIRALVAREKDHRPSKGLAAEIKANEHLAECIC